MNRQVLIQKAIFALTTFYCLTVSANISSKSKIALLIGVGKYQPGGGWNTLHGDNDVLLMKHTLINCGFQEADILTLTNESATKQGIIESLQVLLQKSAAGDIVLIHFSGHGQQISDINNDEPDGLDEALVPYGAPQKDSQPGTKYDGSKHLKDDELNKWFSEFRSKIGPAGQLVVFIDACHSSTASRGIGMVRGGAAPILITSSATKSDPLRKAIEASGYIETSPSGIIPAAQSKFILIAAARADEQAYEYREKEVGYLTYSLAESFNIISRSSDNTYRDLFEYTRNEMSLIVSYQNPSIEGDKDARIFDGNILTQQPFYTVSKGKQASQLKISGGQLYGITAGTQIGLFPIGTRNTVGTKAIVTGKIISADPLQSELKLDQAFSIDSALKLRAFCLGETLNMSQTKIFIGNLPGDITGRIKASLSAKKAVIVTDVNASRIIIDLSKTNTSHIDILNAIDRTPLISSIDFTKKIQDTICGGEPGNLFDASDFIVKTIHNYTRNGILKNASFRDEALQLKIQITALPGQQTSKTDLFAFRENTKTRLTLQNTGNEKGFVYLIEFDPAGRICPLLGFDKQVQLDKGSISEIEFEGFSPPFGRYIVKGYITREPIEDELRWLIAEQNGKTRAVLKSPLVALLDEIIENPGMARSVTTNKSAAVSTTNFSYDLVNQ